MLRSQHVTQASFPLRRIITELVDSGVAMGVFRKDLDPIQVYVTILAVSRFHLANAYSLTALLGVDLTRSDWRKQRYEHSRQLLTSYLLAPAEPH